MKYSLQASNALEAGCANITDVEREYKNANGLYGELKSIP